MRLLALLPIVLGSLFSPILAQNLNSSTFVYNGADNTSLVFAMQVEKSTGDVYFHMSAPAGNSWVGIGFGEQMAGSLMLIAYANRDNKGVTISPRYSTGHVEPVYQSNVKIEYSGINAITDGDDGSNLFANAVCKGCVTWKNGGGLDLTSSAQPFIFAVGPPFPPLRSNSRSAGLTEHIFVGHFTMDMTAATVNSGGKVPSGPFSQSESAHGPTNTQTTSEPGPHIHGLIMCAIFILLLPFGTLVLRVWNSVKYHAIVQCITLVLFLMAAAGGIVVSRAYNRSKNYNSAHQIIGFLILIGLLTQLVMGILHHRVYKKDQRQTIRGRIHLYLGPALIFIGLINGGLGFQLAGNGFVAIPYAIIILVVGALYTCIRVFSWRRQKKRNAVYKNEVPQGYPQQAFGQMPPPNYGQFNESRSEQPYRTPDVPLERYHSSQSLPHYDMPPQEPRHMI